MYGGFIMIGKPPPLTRVHEVSLSTWSNTSPPFFNPMLIAVHTFKHGGHAHHLCAWFGKHASCAVSGCDCNC
jgi:hypothetical protein